VLPQDFSPSTRKHLVRTRTGYWAFVPPPLPPPLDLGTLVTALSQADRSIGELKGIGRWLPNPHLLIGPFLRREAVLSSRIEGTEATVTDLALFEVVPARKRGASDVHEVANYVDALELGLRSDRKLPLSLRLLRDLHGILMRGVRGERVTPGEFRTSQNWIGPPGCLLNDATMVPPPPDEMHDCLGAFEKHLHADSDVPPLIRLALIHYQFEAIHPFLDGNGRIGRLLISLLLHEWNLLHQPLLYLSAYFERRRGDYYDRLLAVSRRGEWEEWIEFFLVGVAEQSLDVIDRSRRLFDLREEYHRRFQSARMSALVLSLVDSLFEQPALTIASARARLDVTPRAAALNVQKLVDAGILREITGRARGRVFLADEILRQLGEAGAHGSVGG
jgi:Fic family protein